MRAVNASGVVDDSHVSYVVNEYGDAACHDNTRPPATAFRTCFKLAFHDADTDTDTDTDILADILAKIVARMSACRSA